MRIRTNNSILVTYARNSNHQTSDLIRELIDNSLDAKSSIVKLDMRPDKFIIVDNGKGISKIRFEESFSNIGHKLEHERDDIGRYNIGMKICLIALGDKCSIHTKTLDESYSVDLNWMDMDSEVEFNALDIQQLGTTILVETPLYKNPYIGKTKDIISKTYKHIISEGLRIEFNGKVVEPAGDIPWLDKDVIYGDGYRIEYGTYDATNRGIYNIKEIAYTTLWFKNRRVAYNVMYGSLMDIAGDYSIQLFVTDGDKYPVNGLKDGIEGAEDIINNHSQQISEFIKPNVAKELEMNINDELGEIANMISERLGRGKRTNGTEHGTVTPKETGIRRRNWSRVNESIGDHTSKNKKSNFLIRPGASDGIGHVIQEKGRTIVCLDKSKPEVACLFSPKVNREAIFYIALFLIQCHSPTPLLPEMASEGVYNMIKGLIGYTKPEVYG